MPEPSEGKIGTGFFRKLNAENQDFMKLAITDVRDDIRECRKDIKDIDTKLSNHMTDDGKMFADTKAGNEAVRAENETNRNRIVSHTDEHFRKDKAAWGSKEWLAALTALVIAATALVKMFLVGDVQEKQTQKQEEIIKKVDETIKDETKK